MAKKTISQFYSDLSGDEIGGSNPTVRFAVDGTSYEIDLTDKEHEAFTKLLAPYVTAGRRATGRGRRGSTPTAGGTSPREIRAWAAANGHDVPSRGRIPASILDAYRAAN